MPYYNDRVAIILYSLLNLSYQFYTDPYPPPQKIAISSVDLLSRTFTISFTWSSVAAALTCPAIQYEIDSSNCGTCPPVSRNPEVTCSYTMPSNGSQCVFAVRAFDCNQILGNWSDTIRVNLTASNAPTTLPRGL